MIVFDPSSRLQLAVFTCLVAAIAGCKTYQLAGKVVAGPASTVQVVDRDDPRLDQPGIDGALIEVMIDPDTLSRKPGGTTTTSGDGGFQLPITEGGAGFLQYDVRLIARLTGFTPAVETFRLPAGRKRLLITLAPGKNNYLPPKNDLLEETMEMSRPYLNE